MKVYNPNTKTLENFNTNMLNWVANVSYITNVSGNNPNETHYTLRLDNNEDGVIQTAALYLDKTLYPTRDYRNYVELEYWNVFLESVNNGCLTTYSYNSSIGDYVWTDTILTTHTIELIDYTKPESSTSNPNNNPTNNTVMNVFDIITCVSVLLMMLIVAASAIYLFIIHKKPRVQENVKPSQIHHEFELEHLTEEDKQNLKEHIARRKAAKQIKE